MNKKRWLIITVIVVAAVLVSILSYTMLVNHPPVTRLGVEATRVFPSESTWIICIASDRDGDELSYEWSTTAGEIHGEGGIITWTAPDYEGIYSVSVTVTDGRGGEITDHITITVKANELPTITSLAADAAWTLPSGSLHVACNASDPDRHKLSYEWSASRGGITGTGASVNWTAPEELGVYDITVVVSDGHGGSATRTVRIGVITGQPPIIEALLVTKERHGHCYLIQEAVSKYKVGREQKYDIECIASHPDDLELRYEWECDGGEIEGEGSLVTWTAPNTSADVTVTVTVSDTAGNTVSESVTLNVVRCSGCTFGSC